MYWVGIGWVLCPFPCDVFAVFQSGTPPLAPSVNVYLKAFLRMVLGYRDKELDTEGGVLGIVKAHYGCVEAQGRGSLHCHMLVWIDGALNPNEIRDKVMRDPEWGKRLLDYLDDTITNVVPQDPAPSMSTPWNERDPCTLRGVDLTIENVEERLLLRMKDVSRLAERVQRHRHSQTCYKYYKVGEERTCRFDLKEDNFRAESSVDPETGQINLRCLDGLVNNFNATILEAVRCNMDIQFIGSGESAKAMIYYITDYITKSQLKSHVAYAALQAAVKKCEDMDDSDGDFTVRSKRLLQKCAYALVSHQELSAQQVASYLMDYEDHFTSHKFNCLYWASFERFIERQDTEKLYERTVTETRDGDVNGGNADMNAGVGETDETNLANVVERPSETSADEEEDEEVSIRVDGSGNISVLADQICDYTLRPLELEAMSLWDFVAKTEKLYAGKRDASRPSIDEDANEDIDTNPDGQGCDNGSDPENQNTQIHGSKAGERFRFLPEHKEYGLKCIRLREVDVVPVPIGPALPRRDDQGSRVQYCRLMVILFKPW